MEGTFSPVATAHEPASGFTEWAFHLWVFHLWVFHLFSWKWSSSFLLSSRLLGIPWNFSRENSHKILSTNFLEHTQSTMQIRYDRRRRSMKMIRQRRFDTVFQIRLRMRTFANLFGESLKVFETTRTKKENIWPEILSEVFGLRHSSNRQEKCSTITGLGQLGRFRTLEFGTSEHFCSKNSWFSLLPGAYLTRKIFHVLGVFEPKGNVHEFKQVFWLQLDSTIDHSTTLTKTLSISLEFALKSESGNEALPRHLVT